MIKLKNLIYILGAILLVVKIFFKDDISNTLSNVLWVLAGIFLLVIIVLEIFTRRK